jgi:alkanesulfonate monooxygenase SsuD/methylene tetrahydromethanopterin reductase-like flavin-dependent oxidoreductase (luciferase family)
MKKLAVVLVAVLCACQGPDPVRVQAERASFALAAKCADGWFKALPFTPHDAELVHKSLADWDQRIKSDEQLLAAPFGGAK